MNYCYMVYGIFTAGQRTWGGPRADAGTADATTTPAQAIEQAETAGDELNVIPESFKPAIEAVTRKPSHRPPLMPSGHLAGRFAPAEELPGGWFQQGNDSGMLHSDMTLRHNGASWSQKHPSRESVDSTMSEHNSVYTPRRVESIIGVEDTTVYRQQQAAQRPAGGAYFESGIEQTDSIPDRGPNDSPRNSILSIQSMASTTSSVSMHFAVPQRIPLPAPSAARVPNTPSAPLKAAPSHPSNDPPRAVRRQRSLSDSALLAPSASTPRLAAQQRAHSSNGRSPLARKSFERVASPPAVKSGSAGPMSARDVIELERAAAAQARSSLESRSRGRRMSAERRLPRKLSKRPRSSRSRDRG